VQNLRLPAQHALRGRVADSRGQLIAELVQLSSGHLDVRRVPFLRTAGDHLRNVHATLRR
jgi:hypothetical protein